MHLFFLLMTILLAAKLGAELCLRIGQPAVLGEILAGVGIGIVIHYAPVDVGPLTGLGDDETFTALSELGAFCLLLAAGVELEARDMLSASKRSMLIAVCGMLVPLAVGAGLGLMVLPESPQRPAQVLFLGTALAITAVPVAIKVLMDLGQLDSEIGHTIVAAAVADDILSLLLLAVLTGMLGNGGVPDLAAIAMIAAKAIGFVVLVALLLRVNSPRVDSLIELLAVEERGFVALLMVGFVLAVLAEALGLHFILGAFAAGLLFSRRAVSRERFERVKSKVDALAHGFLGPIFFVSIGFHLDLSALAATPGFVAVLVLAAFLGKILGAGGAALANGFERRAALAIGVSMSARGVVELIVASVAAKAGLFEVPQPPPPIVANLFSAIVIMAIVTSMAVPPVLRATLGRR
ncbi:MAG: cation:proton antiporter [Gammaproteobacteria bacterium]